MSAHLGGKLIAQWYVFCNLCGKGDSHHKPRIVLYAKAEQAFMKKGWHCVGKRWVCPNCVAHTTHFLKKCQTLEEELRKSFRKAKS